MTNSGEVVSGCLPLAEQMSPEEIRRLNFHGALNARPWQEVCINLELSLAYTAPADKQLAWNQMMEGLGGIGQADPDYFKAKVLLDCLPAFRRRLNREECTVEDYQKIYHSLGSTAADLAEIVVDSIQGGWRESTRTGDFYQATFLAFRARNCALGFKKSALVLPGTDREEASSSKTLNFNHDGYTTHRTRRGNLQKSIPIQLKGRRNAPYSPEICRIKVRNALVWPSAPVLIGDAAEGLTVDKMPEAAARELVMAVGALLRAESLDEELSTKQVRYIDSVNAIFSGRMKAFLDEKARRFYGSSS